MAYKIEEAIKKIHERIWHARSETRFSDGAIDFHIRRSNIASDGAIDFRIRRSNIASESGSL